MNATLKLNDGNSMPVLGLGTWQGEGEEGKEAFLKALELGYRHIDTAYAYENEQDIGDALKEAFQRGVVQREDVFVVSKLPHNGHRPDKVQHFLRKSLQRLGLDFVDLYLIHWPVSTMYVDDDTMTPLGEDKRVMIDDELDHLDTWKAMEECVDEGLTKSIGLSNFNSHQLKKIYDSSRIKPANIQIECNLYLQQEQLIKFCLDMDITVTAYAPLGSPGLSAYAKKKYNIDAPKRKVLLEDPTLEQISKTYHKTPSQVALRFLVQRGLIVIPKTLSEKRLKQNSDIFDFSLSEEDNERLKELDCKLRFFSYDILPEMVASAKYPFSIPF